MQGMVLAAGAEVEDDAADEPEEDEPEEDEPEPLDDEPDDWAPDAVDFAMSPSVPSTRVTLLTLVTASSVAPGT